MTGLVIHPAWSVTPEGERVGFRVDMLGEIPFFLELLDPRDAVAQIDSRYGHGGGWFPVEPSVFKVDLDAMGRPVLRCPGDPALYAWAETYLPHTGERVFYYLHDFVFVLRPDGSHALARVD